jgi:hypothetical protein
VAVQKLGEYTWRPHRTRLALGFERHEGYRDGTYTFREQGYLVRVHRSHVLHREDVATGSPLAARP